VLVLLALPCGAALGSSTGAKRLYQEGKYKEAQQEYERGLSKSGDVNWRALGEAMSKPKAAGREGTDEQFLRALENANLGDPRLHFNAGDAAYKAGDLESAEKHFELAMLSRDLKQQQRAFYNLGNAYFRLGEQNPAPDGKIAQWEKAVQSFEGATRLDPQDADAKFNLEFAKRKLEELKKQQPKQQDQQQQKKDQDKEKEDKQKQNQQQDQKQQPDPSQEQNKQEQKEQQPKPDAEAKNQEQQQKQDAQDQQQAGQQEKKDQQQAKQDKAQGGGKGDEKPGEQTEANAAPTPGQMSVQQARQLLDSQKGEERAMIFVPTQKLKDQRRVFKDW
jgi:Ca-activated chloride channel family protein